MLLDAIKAFREPSSIIYFSTGRDSAVMLDLFFKHYHGKIKVIFFYFYKALPSREAFLKRIENRYGISIKRRPIVDLLRKTDKRITWRMVDDSLRAEFGIDWIARGYRRDESLQRRGMLKYCVNGRDEKNKVFYPLIDWKAGHVREYAKREKLFLPIEYKYGMRDITIYKGMALLWLYNNSPEDYDAIKRQYPDIEGELIRAKSKAAQKL